MSEDIFEGDDNAAERSDFIGDLDLFAVSNKTKKYWKLPERSNLHIALYLMITMGMSYESGEKIMKKIKDTIGDKDMSKENFVISDKTLKEWGLSATKISGIKKILGLKEITQQSLCKVREGGIKLVKMFMVLSETKDDTSLEFCYEVRRNLSNLLGHSKILPEPDAKKLFLKWSGYKSQIGYFLYRLKPDSAVKIVDDIELDQYDFNGFDRS